LPPAESEVVRPASTEIAPSPRWRILVLRSIAAAHFVAGIVEVLKVAGNVVLELPYTAGPLALPGVMTVLLARLVYGLTLSPSADPDAFLRRTNWIAYQAQTTGNFLGAMIAAHLALGALNAALGYGLWRRLSWARWLDAATLGLAGLFAAAHGAAMIWVRGLWRDFGIITTAPALLVAAPIVAFLLSPLTSVLFVSRDDTPTAPRGKRRWWTLSLQWVVGVLVLALALALLLLLGLGPMAEVVWVAAGLTVDRP
jgi:hypothetical protein